MTHARQPPGDPPCQLRHRGFLPLVSSSFFIERETEGFTSSHILLHTDASKADAVVHTTFAWLSLSGRTPAALQTSREIAKNASCFRHKLPV